MLLKNGKSWLDILGYSSALAAGAAALVHNVDVIVIRVRELVTDARRTSQERPTDKRK